MDGARCKHRSWITLTMIFSLLFCYIMLYCSPSVFARDFAPVKDVLILNSYHKGLAWSDDQTRGITDTMRDTEINATLYTEYIDGKRYPSEEDIGKFYDKLKDKYKYVDFDMIIVTDDIALDMALKYREESERDMLPIIFSGINAVGAEKLTEQYDNVTGIIEEIDPAGTVNLALQVNPDIDTVYVLFDNSQSGESTGSIVTDQIHDHFPHLDVISMNNLRYDQVMEEASQLDRNSIILVTTYFSDVTGKTVEFDRFAKELSRQSAVPVYHIFDFGLNDGAIGGSMISGFLQGKYAADLAIRILNGESADQIPFLSENTIRHVFDYAQLQRFDIPVSKLPQGTEIINKPFSFYETYRTLVITIVCAFIILLAFIAVLIIYVRMVRRMKRKLEISNERYALATNGSHAVIWDQDMLTNTFYFSESWYELLGYEKDEVDERNGGWIKLIHPDDVEKKINEENKHLTGQSQYYYCEYRLLDKLGQYRWFQTRGKLLNDAFDNHIRFAGSMTDITELKATELKLQSSYEELETTYEELTALQSELMEQYNKLKDSQLELHELAYRDTLSNLPNKLSLLEELKEFTQNNSDRGLILFFLDIDNFKYINDTMGHNFGDELLVHVSDRLLFLSNGKDKHFRFGGDEYAIILNHIQDQAEVTEYAKRLVQGLKEPFVLEGTQVYITVSIGIAEYPDHAKNAEELLKNADVAMYKAKEQRQGAFVVYDSSMQQPLDERVMIEKYLRTAIANNELYLNYQPIIDLESGNVWGFEALIRWNNPVLGFVSPLSFIQIAEDCRLILPIGEWVLITACHFMKYMHRQGFENYHISVNISVVQLMHEGFTDMVLDVLEETGLDPSFLEIEVTESVVMDSFEATVAKLEFLKTKGIQIALDDFGTGYSSLSYLKQLPIHTLKIDKSFVDGIIDTLDHLSLVDSIVSIGHDLGMKVTAEGVETGDQVAFLQNCKCDKIQGYYFNAPMAEEKVLTWLSEWNEHSRNKLCKHNP
ncbi:Phytochrome-like protein cph2 [compost metagenome]